jgi:predicted SAM-dependent methyltransferase
MTRGRLPAACRPVVIRPKLALSQSYFYKLNSQQPMQPKSPSSIFNSDFQLSFKGHANFEFVSWLGRTFKNRRPPTLSGPQLLNLGSGNNLYPEFVNADFFRSPGAEKKINFWAVDLRYPLNCPADHWDGVYSEHTLEHIFPNQVLALLTEIHRTLKRGAWVRVVVPDVRKYVDYYIGKPSHPLFERWTPRASALRSVSQNYLHFSLWDIDLMADCLRRAGFKTVEPRSYNSGADSRLLKDSQTREYESLYIEAQKS